MTESVQAAASSFQLEPEQWKTFFDDHVKKHKSLCEGYVTYVTEMAERGLPPIFEGRHLSLLMGVEPYALRLIGEKPELNYRSFEIPKRSGGTRLISSPMPTLLHCQRWIDWFVLRQLPTHDAAHGFVKDRSNITNASVHLKQNQLLCVDIENFFGSIGRDKVMKFFLQLGYPKNVAFLLTRTVTHNDVLPQGGASSPQLSNLLMRDFDELMMKLATSKRLKYTRYADDIVMSGDQIDASIISEIRELLRLEYLSLNDKKTRVYRGVKKMVTGISIGSGEMKLPRKMRRRFKNEAFIAIKCLEADGLDALTEGDLLRIERIKGQLGYWSCVETENVQPKMLREQLDKTIVNL